MRVENNHAHADTFYTQTKIDHYVRLAQNLVETRKEGYLSLNVHIPYEIQHPNVYPKLRNGLLFVRFGEVLKKIVGVPLYWENAPELNYGTWDLAYGQSDWAHVPRDIDLTLDVGHLMLGAGSIEDARNLIEAVIEDRHSQIKHLHIHENNLLSDEHWSTGKVITDELIQTITEGRTYIFEKGESIDGETPRTGEWMLEE